MSAVPVIVASANGAGALAEGIAVLVRGGAALDAVEACARAVESDPADQSVGIGGLPNILGTVELDASIMDGTGLRAGAVAALSGFAHPISVARAVMESLPHVLLAGDGAARFAREIGAEAAELLTAESRLAWEERLRALGLTADAFDRDGLAAVVRRALRAEYGTVNFLAVDARGGVASAVTTSGWGFKYPGRVGDSPIVGAGNYADSRWGAAACTGFGELALRTGAARIAVERLSRGVSADRVAAGGVADANAIEFRPFHILVLSSGGVHAAASNVADRTYCCQTVGMREAMVVRRQLVTPIGSDTGVRPLVSETWDTT